LSVVAQAGERKADELFWGYERWKAKSSKLTSLEWMSIRSPRAIEKGLVFWGLSALGKSRKVRAMSFFWAREFRVSACFWGGVHAFSRTRQNRTCCHPRPYGASFSEEDFLGGDPPDP